MYQKFFALILTAFVSCTAKMSITINNQTPDDLTIYFDKYRSSKHPGWTNTKPGGKEKLEQKKYSLKVPRHSEQYNEIPSSEHTVSGKVHYIYDLSHNNNYFALAVSKSSAWNVIKNKKGEFIFTRK